MDDSMEAERRKFNNSAIGSWNGYIYQGLCAIQVVLRYLEEAIGNDVLKEKYDNYKLYLDGKPFTFRKVI